MMGRFECPHGGMELTRQRPRTLTRQKAEKRLSFHKEPEKKRLGKNFNEDFWIYFAYGKKFIRESAKIVIVGVGVGLMSLRYFSYVDPEKMPAGTHGWPEVAALPLALSIIGSSLSFLLVFRLSWAFSRWSDARSLLGATTTRLKRFSVLVHSQLMDEGTAAQRALLEEVTGVCDLFFGAFILSLEMGPGYEYPRGDERGADIIGRTAHEQVLATHQWLAHLVRKGGELGLVPVSAAHSAYDDHGFLLSEYFSSLKIKTTPLPLPLQCLVTILKLSYCVFIFPQTMAYAFVMKLTSDEHQKHLLWRNGAYISAYLVITSLGILFFTVMHLIALELDDPYGHDLSDLPLKQIHNSLKKDLESIQRTSARVFHAHTKAGDLKLGDVDVASTANNAKRRPVVAAVAHRISASSPTLQSVVAHSARDLKIAKNAAHTFASHHHHLGPAISSPLAHHHVHEPQKTASQTRSAADHENALFETLIAEHLNDNDDAPGDASSPV